MQFAKFADLVAYKRRRWENGSTMRIESLEARAVLVPLTTPTALSTREIKGREYVIVRVVDDAGNSGVGYTYAGAGGPWLRDGIAELLAPRLRGRRALGIEETWDWIFRDLLLLGRRGALLRMLSAVDIALWDLAARKAGMPLRRLLGGARDSVPAYASGGYFRPGDPCENVKAELERYSALGFTDFKLKFGGLPLPDDLAQIAQARRTIGPDARLALDLNNGWETLDQALRAIDALRGFHIWWIEEPFPPDDIRNHALLAARSPIPIATGAIEATRWGFAQLIDAKAAHILQPDVCVAGGVTEWRRIAAVAASHGIPVFPHWHANLHAQLAAATPNAPAVEYFALAEGIYSFEQVVDNPLAVEGGRIFLDETPGIGVEIDWDAVESFAITSASNVSSSEDEPRQAFAHNGGSYAQPTVALTGARSTALPGRARSFLGIGGPDGS
jgi:L-alanine-DL-glutamate epimerase-like enolase superfamily enzyme